MFLCEEWASVSKLCGSKTGATKRHEHVAESKVGTINEDKEDRALKTFGAAPFGSRKTYREVGLAEGD